MSWASHTHMHTHMKCTQLLTRTQPVRMHVYLYAGKHPPSQPCMYITSYIRNRQEYDPKTKCSIAHMSMLLGG